MFGVLLSGEYSCLQVDLLFAREVSYYIITIYLPTLMIVIVSWFSFWIDHKSVSITYIRHMCNVGPPTIFFLPGRHQPGSTCV